MQRHYPLDPSTGVENSAIAWTDGVPATGVEGAYPPHLLCTNPQDELLNLITAAGLTPTDSDMTQVFQAFSFGGIWVGAFGYTAAITGASPAPEMYTAAIPGGVTVPALKVGMRIVGIVPTTNTTTSPVLAVAGFTIGSAGAPIKKRDGSAPAANDVAAAIAVFRFDGTNWRAEGLVASDIAVSTTTISNILGTLRSIQNVIPIQITGRAVISGSGAGTFTTAWSGSYTKKSATSNLLVWPNLNLFNAASPNTGVAPTTLRLQAGSAAPNDTFAQVGFQITNGAGGVVTLVNNNAGPSFVSGLGTGAQAISLQLSRTDAAAWNAILNPITSDNGAFPAATQSTLIIAEVEP